MAADMAMTVLASRPLAEALASDGGTGGSGQPGNAARGRGLPDRRDHPAGRPVRSRARVTDHKLSRLPFLGATITLFNTGRCCATMGLYGPVAIAAVVLD